MGAQAKVEAMGSKLWDVEVQQRENAWLEGRDANLAAYKRGVDNVMLLFSSRDGELVVEFPWMTAFQAVVQPLIHQARCRPLLVPPGVRCHAGRHTNRPSQGLLHLARCQQGWSASHSQRAGWRLAQPSSSEPRVPQVLGAADVPKLLRVQLARLRAGTTIQPHSDKGGYATGGHRIHIPLAISSSSLFLACPECACLAARPAPSFLEGSGGRTRCAQDQLPRRALPDERPRVQAGRAHPARGVPGGAPGCGAGV